MPNHAVDYTGKKLNKLTVIKRDGYIHYAKRSWIAWVCKCDCGKVIRIPAVLVGRKYNCGCKHKNRAERSVYKCLQCGKEYEPKKLKHKYQFCSRECYSKYRSKVYINDKNGMWKGDDVGLTAIHSWIKRKLGNPMKCDICGSTSKKRYDWSNKDHKYSRNKDDWQRLCVSCHRKFDNKFNNKKNEQL